MKQRLKATLRRKAVNFFGGLGYFFCCMQWLLAILLYFSFIKSALSLLVPTASHHQAIVIPPVPHNVQAAGPSILGIFLIILVLVVTVAIVVLAIYLFFKTPSTIAKTSQKIVHQTTEAITPVVLHMQHVQDTVPNHRKIAFRVSLIIKIAIIAAPLVLAFCSQFIQKPVLDFYIAMYVSTWLAALTIISFVFQYILAKLLSIKRQDIL